eukprot:1158209-Pelagomonas_calceolata.AAC.4
MPCPAAAVAPTEARPLEKVVGLGDPGPKAALAPLLLLLLPLLLPGGPPSRLGMDHCRRAAAASGLEKPTLPCRSKRVPGGSCKEGGQQGGEGQWVKGCTGWSSSACVLRVVGDASTKCMCTNESTKI